MDSRGDRLVPALAFTRAGASPARVVASQEQALRRPPEKKGELSFHLAAAPFLLIRTGAPGGAVPVSGL